MSVHKVQVDSSAFIYKAVLMWCRELNQAGDNKQKKGSFKPKMQHDGGGFTAFKPDMNHTHPGEGPASYTPQKQQQQQMNHATTDKSKQSCEQVVRRRFFVFVQILNPQNFGPPIAEETSVNIVCWREQGRAIIPDNQVALPVDIPWITAVIFLRWMWRDWSVYITHKCECVYACNKLYPHSNGYLFGCYYVWCILLCTYFSA